MAFNTNALYPSASSRHEASSSMWWSSKMNGISYSVISGSQIQESNFLLHIKKPLILFHLKIFQLHSGILCPFIWHAGPPSGQLWAYAPAPKKKKKNLGMPFASVLRVGASCDIKFTFLLISSHNSIPQGHLYQGIDSWPRMLKLKIPY